MPKNNEKSYGTCYFGPKVNQYLMRNYHYLHLIGEFFLKKICLSHIFFYFSISFFFDLNVKEEQHIKQRQMDYFYIPQMQKAIKSLFWKAIPPNGF